MVLRPAKLIYVTAPSNTRSRTPLGLGGKAWEMRPSLELRLTLLGVGAMKSPRYAPAGLLAEHGRERVAIDGGPGAAPGSPPAAWLVTDERAELIRELRHMAAA